MSSLRAGRNAARSRSNSGGEKRIRISFETVTPESAEQGDAAERGWIDEEGESMDPDADDRAEGLTAVDKAADFLDDQGVSPSASHFHPGLWYTTTDPDTDLRTGETEYRSYHLVGFTTEEQQEIFDDLMGDEEDDD